MARPVSLTLLRQRYPHAIRRVEPRDGFNDLADIAAWLKETGYPTQSLVEEGAVRVVEWRFETETAAWRFMNTFGGTPDTDVEPLPRLAFAAMPHALAEDAIPF